MADKNRNAPAARPFSTLQLDHTSMDSFGKVVKAGLSKAYAVGQQQLQQHVGRRENQGPSNSQYSAPPSNTYYATPTPVPAGQANSHYPPGPPQRENSRYGYPNTSSSGHPAQHSTPYFPPPPGHPGQESVAQGLFGSPPEPAGVSYANSSVAEQITYPNCPIPPAYNTGRPSHNQPPPSPYNSGQPHAPAWRPPMNPSHTIYAPPVQEAYHSQIPASSPSYQPQYAAPQAPPARPFMPPAPSPPAATSTSYQYQPAVANSETQSAASASATALPHSAFLSSAQVSTTQQAAHPYYPPPAASQSLQHPDPSIGSTSSASFHVTQKEQRRSYSPSPPPPPPPPPRAPSRNPSETNYALPAAYDKGGKPNLEVPAPDAQHVTPAQDSLTEFTSQMGNLSVRTENDPPQHAKDIPSQTRAPREVQMKATGAPNDIVQFCPEGRIVTYSLYWYHHADLPGYLICTRCHADHIEKSSLAAKFQRVKRPDDSSSTCGFWYPRIRDTLWPLACRSNNSDDLLAFMKRRLEIPSCKGRVVVAGAEGIKWFGMVASDIAGFLACEACYEDRVMGTAFEPRFKPYQKPGAWICDMCMPYISRAVAEMSKRNDWPSFVAGSTRRLGLPVCEGKDVQANTINWYIPRRKIENMHVCEACYMDKLAMTLFDTEFQSDEPVSGFDAWMEQLGRRWTCMLSDSTISMLFALENSIRQQDYMVFWNAARTFCDLIPCSANGIIGGNWWTVTGGCDGLSVCEACNAGILRTSEVDMFFEPVQRDRESTIVCSFCRASPRFMQFLGKYVEALDKGTFSYYSDHVKKFAGVQACPGIKHREKATWWGYPEALFCEDCHLSFVADTSLASTLVLKGEYDERAQICQIWSPRMRTMFLKVCAAGPPGSPESQAALDEFRAFGSRRLQVYNQTVPQIDFIREMKQMRMANAMQQGMLGLMYQGMNSQAVLSGTTDDCLHGNSSLGWYETEHGATGAQMFNNMQTGMSNANRPDEWMQMAQLQSIWNEVE